GDGADQVGAASDSLAMRQHRDLVRRQARVVAVGDAVVQPAAVDAEGAGRGVFTDGPGRFGPGVGLVVVDEVRWILREQLFAGARLRVRRFTAAARGGEERRRA